MDSLFVSMATFALAGSISPGPVNIIAATSGARHGLNRAFIYVAGAAISYAIVVFISGLMLDVLLNALPQLAYYVRVAGSGFLLYMAYNLVSSSAQSVEAHSAQPFSPGFINGVLTQWLNPKAWLYASSGVSLFTAHSSSPSWHLAIFVGISLVVCFIGVGSWACFGKAIAHWLNSPVRQRMFNCSMGVLLAVTVAGMWWESPII